MAESEPGSPIASESRDATNPSARSASDVRKQLSAESRRAIKAMSTPIPSRGVVKYLATYLQIGAARALHLFAQNPFVTVLAIFFIAARQHSLYVLNHDASHDMLFASKDMNRRVASLLSNAIFFHHPEAYSFVQWRRRHRMHHRYLYTDRDLDLASRVRQGDTEHGFSRTELFIDLLKTGLKSSLGLFTASQECVDADEKTLRPARGSHLALLFRRIESDPEMEQERVQKLICFAILLPPLLYLAPTTFLLMWIVPMYTVYPAILRLMDLTEHVLRVDTLEVLENTRSTVPGMLGTLFVSDTNRTYHREHHMYSAVPFHALPELTAILGRETNMASPTQGLLRTSGQLG
jgi:fatty acid desaturase